jgi:DNA modification methylase
VTRVAKSPGAPRPGFDPPDSATEPLERLQAEYERLESQLTVRWNDAYKGLVVPNGNASVAVHRWFRLKEAFSADLLSRVLEDAEIETETGLRILDPFIGSGTTAVSAARLVREEILPKAFVTGFECNPFIHLVASAKLRALQKPTTTLLPLAKRIAAQVAQDEICAPAPPQLAAFSNADYFAPEDLKRLLQLRVAIELAARDGADPLDVDLAQVCLGAVVEPVSSLRRDGRALRYVPGKERPEPIAAFLEQAHQVNEDMPAEGVRIRGDVILGDGRTLTPEGPPENSIDLALFSPPYPNNIDYTEVYKLETWLLAFIEDNEQFAEQRMKTLYSHPSLLRPRTQPDENDGPDDGLPTCVEALLQAVPDDRYSRARRSMISGYSKDMSQTLAVCHKALRPGGTLVYVVGNSLHGSGSSAFIIAADLIIADLGSSIGFDVESIEIARGLRRRRHNSPFLRESVVCLRKPQPGQKER